MAKKSAKKTTTKKAKIKDEESLMEDMKKLAMKAPKEEIKQEKVVEVKEEEVVEDLSFIEEIKEEKNEVVEEKKEEVKRENKPRKMTYEQMFGPTWMGYGYTEC